MALIQNDAFLSSDAAEIVHRLFSLQSTYNIDLQTFLDMLQQAGEEQLVMDLKDERYVSKTHDLLYGAI
jgi:hypothetical protein